jgi:anti-sigma B factor antagonist
MTLDTTVTRAEPGMVVVAFAGELDISRTEEAELELERVEADGPEILVLDLRGLEFLDSSGLRVILGADTRARRAGRSVVIVRGVEKVQRVFRITLLDRRFDFVDDPEDVRGRRESDD